MQGYIENLVKQMKVHSRCILKHANLPPRFWSETNTLYMAVRNIMPRDKMKVPFKSAPSHRLHFTGLPRDLTSGQSLDSEHRRNRVPQGGRDF